ncbi:MAG: glutathione S-transferase family protein [Hyphomicrobiaceae bacterium]|nr:glutathione S-transferase family protein [Hyphomicrobiaceae bacterium]
MSDIILHHYPQSPVAEKVRVGLGVKQLAWRSVQIPRVPPKPDLMPLTGGYRRTPVMQVGADIYCDSQCILREIDRRHPEPTFYPGGGQGMPWVLSRWSDTILFDQIVRVVLGFSAEEMPSDLLEDRARLYFGPDWDMETVKASLPHTLAQIRAQLGWVDERVAHGRDFLLVEPGLPDVLVYYLVWFLRGRWEGSTEFLSEFPALEAWEARMKAIGHGDPTDMTSTEAIEIAKSSDPQTSENEDSRDPQGLMPGMNVSVVPDGDGGDPPVAGIIRTVTRDSIAILREDDRVGQVCVHFPRVGYRVVKL